MDPAADAPASLRRVVGPISRLGSEKAFLLAGVAPRIADKGAE